MRKKILLLIVVVLALSLIYCFNYFKCDKKVFKKSGVTYINDILIVNKKYKLPKDYNPGIDSIALGQLNRLIKDSNFDLYIVSDFRTYDVQKKLYDNSIRERGYKYTEKYVARAGYSEHQTGLAFDVLDKNSSKEDFEFTKSAKWLNDNCYYYGFIIRYPKDKENITNYKYEPWHLRYVGEKVAKEIMKKEITLEEYLNID